jgi:hypothetical protein
MCGNIVEIGDSNTHQCTSQSIERLVCLQLSKILPAQLNAHPRKKFYWRIILLKVVLLKVESFLFKVESFYWKIDWLKVISLKVKSLLKVESHCLKTMTWGIYISKLSIYLVNSLSQTLHLICVEMKRESLPSLVNRILHRFKLLTKDKVVFLLFVLVSVVLKEVALDFMLSSQRDEQAQVTSLVL